MARRSDYPFRKSDVKFGTNLIATLFSIPISLGARTVIDGSKDLLSTYPTDTAKIPSEATQGKIGRLEFAIGVIGLTLLLTLGVYWACLPKGYAIVSFFGEILIISSLVLLIFLISAFVTQCIEEIKTGNDVLSLQKGYQWVEIDDSLVNIFYQSLNVELYFYFTRPLLSEAEYQQVQSKRFKKNLKTYQEYKMAWHHFYWNYSFQMKVHNTLKDSVQYMITCYPMMPEVQFYSHMERNLKSQLNYSETLFYKTEVRDIKTCCSYGFVIEKMIPFKMMNRNCQEG